MSEKISEIIFNSISDGVFTVDQDCVISSFNPAAEKITGFKAREAIGKHCFDVFRTEVCHKSCALKDTLKTADPVENARVTIITRDKREVPIRVTTTLLKDGDGAIVGAVEFFRDISEIEHLRESLDRKRGLEDIVSVNRQMQQLIDLLPDVAEAECNVLIEGPSGSGKELVAQVIHNLSPRRYGPYIKINCAALPAQLLESELFGYEKGAFTDAKRNKPGQFGLANGGTLLLDEISEMDPSLQVKLLRVLNNGEYQPLGSTKAMRTNARILAATNANLQESISQGTLSRGSLLPDQRGRYPDPGSSRTARGYSPAGQSFPGCFPVAGGASPSPGFRRRPWRLCGNTRFPGNVRELENAIEHAFVMCHGDEIELDHLPVQIIAQSEMASSVTLKGDSEKDVLAEVLRRHKGNRTQAAKELGMHRSTLWRKIKSYGLVS